ncbi:MAG: tyrosine-type recombinase/integrase [Rhizobiaceae bacterium]|nr:tyrosine-type recombinase/integrase [Rhizobiaceae bacterium]
MSEFLTLRGSIWHFVRRVPAEFSELDRRGIVRHSTRIRIADDRVGRRAARVAQKLNEALELHWKSLATERPTSSLSPYDDARRRARELGYDYVPNEKLIVLPLERILERLETLVSKGLVQDPGARTAVLGTRKPDAFLLSQLFEQFEAATKDETRDFSPDQRRIWRNGRKRTVESFVKVVGDKPVTAITEADGIDYTEWWRERVIEESMAVKSANKDIGQLSRMLKEMSIRRRLNLPDIFKGLRLRGEVEKSRQPFDPWFIQAKLIAGSALEGLNEDARFVLYVMMDTGLRPSEVVNLREGTIFLDAKIPYVKVEADGRRLKTEDSAREIPLTGIALAAIRQRPTGFPKYRDRATVLSATVNKYLSENGLRPTKDHTLYSLRHSFKDRLVAIEAPDSLIDSLMGHRTYKPKYGRGPSLELKLKFLERIAFTVPDRLA